jgi:hypothetical protein
MTYGQGLVIGFFMGISVSSAIVAVLTAILQLQ